MNDDLWGLFPDSYICVDCGMDTWPGHQTRAEIERDMRVARERGTNWRGTTMTFTAETEVYYVHPHVWEKSGIDFWSGCLCIGCLESRIGRRLQPFDFIPDNGFNDPKLPGTRRRLDRLVGSDNLIPALDEQEPLLEPSKLDSALAAVLGKRWSFPK
jgi:hypothetical protein